MAQRMIHLLFCERAMEKIPILDKNRFRIGNLLPDAYAEHKWRNKTHFVKRIDNGKYVYLNFEDFRMQYGRQMLKDDLYLGYYMHLIVDAFWRKFLYKDYDLQGKICSSEDVERLHLDYHLLNAYIVEKYGMYNQLQVIAEFAYEELNKITSFDLEKMLKDADEDFKECINGEAKLITEKMLDEFVDKYIEMCVHEICTVKERREYLTAESFRWKYGGVK